MRAGYVSRPLAVEILYISHCVPWPPDKGERIRAHHSLRTLLDHFPVHLACVARSEQEAAADSPLRQRCASVAIEPLAPRRALLRAGLHFAAGGCLTAKFYQSPPLEAHIARLLRRAPIGAVVLLSSGMAYYAPTSLPYIADWGDVDSEKRLAYGRMRFGGLIHRLEGQRLRVVERDYAMRARMTFLTTDNELALFRSFAPDVPAACCGNGVDGTNFDPGASFAIPDGLRRRRFIVFVGMCDYYPNADGICRFAAEVFPTLRSRHPDIELFVVGRNPTGEVQSLAERDGVTVTGAVDDVRPYLAAAQGVVVPLRIARGVQNKVLEALAMGKSVLASKEVANTFHPDLPRGLICCRSAEEYAAAVDALPPGSAPDPSIVAAARARFDWAASLRPLIDALNAIAKERCVA